MPSAFRSLFLEPPLTFAPNNNQALDRNYQLRQTARALNRVSKFLVFVSLGIYPLQYLELMPALADPWHGVLFLAILLAGLYLQHSSEIRLQRIILAGEDPIASQILTILSDRPEASLSQLATALGIPRNRLEGRRFALQENLANPYIELSRDGSVWRLTDNGQDASTDLLKWADDPNLTRHLEEPNWSDALRGRQDGGIDLWRCSGCGHYLISPAFQQEASERAWKAHFCEQGLPKRYRSLHMSLYGPGISGSGWITSEQLKTRLEGGHPCSEKESET